MSQHRRVPTCKRLKTNRYQNQNMKGLLQKVLEATDCGRCLDDMDFGAGENMPAHGSPPDIRRLNRMF